MTKEKLIIIGGSGLGREVIWLARATERFEILGLLDDNPALHGTSLCGVPVLGGSDDWRNYPTAQFVIAINNPRIRKSIADRMESTGAPKFATLIHPGVQMSEYVTIGHGSLIAAGNVLTTQITLGKHVIVNLSCTIGHDVVVGDYGTFNPQVVVSGNITFGDGVEVGTGAVLRQGLEIGEGAMIGMGSVVTKPVAENSMVFGNPARFVKKLQEWS